MKNLYLLLLALFTAVAASAQCVASFTGTQVPTGNDLLNVNFTNSSGYGTPFSGQYKMLYITYGDGAKSTRYGTAISAHIYASPGTYIVGMRITSMDSSTFSMTCTDSATISVTVVQPPCGTHISVSGAGATKSFSVTNPAGISGISYSWAFGDGGTATGSSPIHTYTTSGLYTISCASAAGTPSCTYINTMTMWVTAAATPLNCSLLKAAFTVVGGGGSSVGINNTSPILGGPYMTGARWDYGDGTTGGGWNPPPHVYTATGAYTIKLVMEWMDSLSTTVCRDSTTRNVTITSISPATIGGYVEYDSLTYGYDTFKVWLIQFDPATNILSAVDSQIVMKNAVKSPVFSFANKPAGNYLAKAAVFNGPTSGTGLIPTYHIYSATWSSATTINALPGSNTWNYIDMMTGTVTSGPGFVGGNVSLGANKGASAGVEGMTIFLRNASAAVIKMTSTDANGDFSFSNIPVGSYSVYPESMNYATTPASVSVSSGSSSVTGINFFQDNTKMNIKQHLLAVSSIPGNAAFWSIYPNPAGRELNISWNGAPASGVTIMDVAGKTVLRVSLPETSSGQQRIDISALRPGLYFVHGGGTWSSTVGKLVVE